MSISSPVETVLDRLGSLVDRDVSMAALCTYRVGGRAAGVIEVDDVETLERVRSAMVDVGEAIPTLVVGRGSNLLVSDRGFPGLVLRLASEFEQIEIDRSEFTVIAGGAALLPVVARKSAAAGLTGFEWAVGVPGSIGGAVRMNAGGHGSDMAASLTRVTTFDLLEGGPRQRTVAELELGYRSSSIGPREIVLWAELLLSPGITATSEAEIGEIVRWRREHQPGGQNAGSVFANPAGDSAGRLIDAAGLKGLRLGTAAVSEKHANFIQADPDGRADDVFRLIREVQRRVGETFGIDLQTENILVGFDENGTGHRNEAGERGAAGDGRR